MTLILFSGDGPGQLAQYKAPPRIWKRPSSWRPKSDLLGRASRNYSIAESVMETVTSLSPRELRAKYRLGELYWRAGAVMRARDVWGELVAKVPRHWGAHLRLAQYYQGVADLKKATEHYNAVIEVKPHNTRVLEQLILIHNQQGLYAQAEVFRASYLSYRRRDRREVRTVLKPEPAETTAPEIRRGPVSSRPTRRHHPTNG